MNDSVFQLRSGQLADLLGIGADPLDSRAADDRSVAEVLAETLAGELPLDVSVSDSMPAVLGRSCDELMTHRGRTVCQFLSDPQTDVASATFGRILGVGGTRGMQMNAKLTF